MKLSISAIILTAVFTMGASLLATAQPSNSFAEKGIIDAKNPTATPLFEPISKEQLASMIANATTPADHQKIADYYRGLSKSFMAESYKHARMSAEYARNPAQGVHILSDHCKLLTKDYKSKSEKAAELAAQHEQMAKDAGHPVPSSRYGK